MKKFLMYILACVFTMSLASCGGGNEPSAVAKSYYDAVFAGDFKGAVDQMHFSRELTAEDKEQFAGLMQGLWSAAKYTGFEITGEEVAEDGKTAKVFMKITEEGKDEPKEETVKMVNVDGTWLVDSGK